MFQNLQKKYLILSTIVICIVLLAGLVLIYNAAAGARLRDTEALLAQILRTGGDARRVFTEGMPQDPEELVNSPQWETYYAMQTSSYFLTSESAGSVSGITLTNAVGITEEAARTLTQNASAEGKDTGNIGRFSYLRQRVPQGYQYVFLDVSRERMEDLRLLTALVGSGVLMGAVLIAAAVFFALRSLRPAEQLIEAGADIMAKSAQGMEKGAAYLLSSYKERGSAVSSPALAEGAVLTSIAADLHGVAQAARRPERPQHVDMTALMEEMAAAYRDRFRAQHLVVHESVEQGVHTYGQPAELTAVLEILFTSVCENAAAGGDVFLDLLSDGSSLGIIVRYAVEELPGLAPEVLFDGDRSRQTPLSAGLYAARLLARLNKGELSAEYLDPPSVCFTLRFAAGSPRLYRGIKR